MCLIGFIMGCTPHPVSLDEDFGRSYTMAKTNQILLPDTERNLEPVTGLDGTAADKSYEAYQESFGKKAQAGQAAGPSILTLLPGVSQ